MERLLSVGGIRMETELAPESVLPCQLRDRLFGTAALQPEKRLQLAVLQNALATFHRLVGLQGRRHSRLFAEVEQWFASDEARDPFTFVTICATLNLDPGYVRAGLRHWRLLVGGSTKRGLRFRRDAVGTRTRVMSRHLHRARTAPCDAMQAMKRSARRMHRNINEVIT
jgi:hypothetical protein